MALQDLSSDSLENRRDTARERSLAITKAAVPYVSALTLQGTLRGSKFTTAAELTLWMEAVVMTVRDLNEAGALLRNEALSEAMGLPHRQRLLHCSLVGALQRWWGEVTSEPPMHRIIQYLHGMGMG
ncbi:hypothetical protein NDU88_006120 [Pleurodeles waltl]|uniref:Uncharacterized protein n=1 Tax=Pleurodeles waltl TaxID=8319 RepID=A0AAV7TYL1_PLEWA|nr:hypothetical protein NDU88_006120 [Pleurodeles waltl]